jgi:HSP20 family protein
MTTKEMTRREENQVDTTRQVLTPPVDILENEHEYLVISDLPGVKPEDVKVELHNGELTIRAPASFGAGVDLISGGRAGYEYARRFRVPAGIAGDKVAAKLNLGVLELRIPKEEARKPRQIEVRAS